MQPSRRAFLTGRRPPESPWQIFCRRLARLLPDAYIEAPAEGRAPLAWAAPAEAAQVRQLRDWCAELGVQMAPAGVCQGLADAVEGPLARTAGIWSQRDPGLPAVCIDVRRHLTHLVSEADGRLWRAGPGCTISQLPEVIADDLLAQCRGGDMQTLAAWFARGGRSRYLRAVDVMLADGTLERFGPFGVDGQRPLRSTVVQRLIPALFDLSREPQVQAWCDAQNWPLRYRLDAMRADDAHVPDLARLLAGSGGTLVWVEQVVFDLAREEADDASQQSAAEPQAVELERKIKALFDPRKILPHLPE